jgi:ubiquinone biosynthesis protein Coq4
MLKIDGAPASASSRVGSRSVFFKLRSAYELVKTIDTPWQADIRFGINALVDDVLETVDEDAVFSRSSDSAYAKLFQEQYDPPIDLEALRRLPDGTLGRQFATFVETHALVPLDALLRKRMKQSLVLYCLLRSYKLHDILHVVLDCDASVAGELKIVAFSLGQSNRYAGKVGRSAATALGILLLHLGIKDHASLGDALKTAVAWYERGQRAPDNVAFRFEDWWSAPVEDVKKAYFGPTGEGLLLPRVDVR